jgi:hypothetical protein
VFCFPPCQPYRGFASKTPPNGVGDKFTIERGREEK